MIEEQLVAKVLTRLDEDRDALPEAKDLVFAALLGQLDEYLSHGAEVTWEPGGGSTARAPLAFVKSIGVEGFRGIGRPVRLNLAPVPGLTLVTGPNGSAKSSFVEALDLVLARDVRRWARDRSKAWKDGWKNLHHADGVALDAELVLEGHSAPVTARMRWSATAKLDEAELAQSDPALAFDEPLATYRPFLAYAELGSMLEEGPARLYDALASILGLDDLVLAADSLQRARLALAAAHKQTKSVLEGLRERLAALPDERAALCADALQGRTWDLARVEAVTSAAPDAADAEPELATLRALTALAVPAPEEVERLAAEVRAAEAAVTATVGTDTDRARLAADTLRAALGLHEHSGDGDCPVCGRTDAVDRAWRARAESEVARLEAEARAAEQARARLKQAERKATDLLRDVPEALARASAVGLDATGLLREWTAWRALRGSVGLELAAGLERCCRSLAAAATALKTLAVERLTAKEDEWRPLARALSEWVPSALRLFDEADTVKRLKAAEDWLRDLTTTLRNERFEPIRSKVTTLWNLLRTRSSVDLCEITFSGRATRRQVDLQATVDGSAAVALGVMSQGELSALALCLFLARATLEASPFRFVVLDDPVQALDESKVEGLARVLDRIARERQVVVFTHDTRLREAVRRLGLAASVIEVERDEGSVVRLKQGRELCGES